MKNCENVHKYFALELENLSVIGYNGAFNESAYRKISNELNKEVHIYSLSTRPEAKQKNFLFKRIGRYKPKNKEPGDPLLLYRHEETPNTPFLIFNSKLIAEQRFLCQFKNCFMHFDRLAKLKTHEKECENRRGVVEAVPRAYGQPISPIAKLIDLGLLDDEFISFIKRKIVTYDIETYESPIGLKTCETTIHSSLRLLSIAIGSNFGVEHFLVRNDDSPKSASDLVERFVRILYELSQGEAGQLPDEFFLALEKLESLIENESQMKARLKLLGLKRELKEYMKLSVFGFNSAKFDLAVLSPYLIPILKQEYPKKLHIIKKGSTFFSISTEHYVFKDAMLFTTPMTLSKYLKQSKINENKSIWPYTLFKSVSDIANCKTFPSKDAFYNDIKDIPVDDNDYSIARGQFYANQALNPDYSMMDWLRYYNLTDVGPFARAIAVQFDIFHQAFNVDPSLCSSLPKFAMICLFDLFSKKAPLAYSFSSLSPSEHQLFRNNIVGGLVNVFSRYTELRDDIDAPRNAKYAGNGERFTKITFLDFNALYLYAQNQKMPTTPGILWTKGAKFYKQTMMARETSFAAHRWLTFIDEYSSDLISSNGERVPLQHAYFRGEHQVMNWKIDGYACVDGVDHFYEFLGCYFHDCCPVCKSGKTDTAWELKKAYLQSAGKLTYIHECVWSKRITLKHHTRSLYWGKIFMRHTEEHLLEEIRLEKVFGFVVADVTCPSEVYEKIKHLNFPPVIQRMTLNEDHVSPYMKTRAEAANREMKQETVVQTYNGKQLLLMTPLVAFYLRLGLQITNITKFTQYRAEQCLGDFCRKITDGRVKSLEDKNDSLANAFKTVGNCGYGKMGEIVKRPDTQFLTEEELQRAVKKPRYKYSEPLTQEDGDYEITQVTMDKLKINDDKPIVLAVAILQQSKLLFLKFVYDVLHKFLVPGSFKLNYCDTDSLAISTTRTAPSDKTNRSQTISTFLPIVRPELRDQFINEMDQWFVVEETERNKKTPGLMKTEWSTESGALIALGNKLYMGIDPETGLEKRSSKGIPHRVKVEFDFMLECLKGHTLENNTFNLNGLLSKSQQALISKKMNWSFFERWGIFVSYEPIRL
ncbi:Oidioi.mRNA.OKI2018_I69.chr1.g794.t1.cds [Oikopleura dioica]|uniref:Oidioi.mRNA.OKI2018_I69.chr1.g794.t1.cds n=1 Tax=Oikopleura dioica TaxID=34765 RepID=A0ABN7SQ70_OIKDI|nr:Oidioi.mRNA.OKI2018_I69.chr1.g794.t1.cds [Oikopleura dioica]